MSSETGHHQSAPGPPCPTSQTKRTPGHDAPTNQCKLGKHARISAIPASPGALASPPPAPAHVRTHRCTKHTHARAHTSDALTHGYHTPAPTYVYTHTQPHHRPRTGTPYTHRPTHLHVHPHNLEKNRGEQRESGTLSIYLKDTKPNFNRGHLSQTSKGATIWIHRSLHQKPLLQPQGCKRLQKSRRLAVLREAASTVALGCHLGICTWGVFPFA